MKALDIFTAAPLGAIVSFSDGTPRPPERFKRKLSDWENRNGQGRLTSRHEYGAGHKSFSLHLGNFGAVVTVITFNRSFSRMESDGFEVVSYPEPGRFAVVSHSQHTGDAWQGDFATLEQARAKSAGWPGSTIHTIGEAGALSEPVAGDDANTIEAIANRTGGLQVN